MFFIGLFQSCPRVTFLELDPKRRNFDPTRTDPRLPTNSTTRPPHMRPLSPYVLYYVSWVRHKSCQHETIYNCCMISRGTVDIISLQVLWCIPPVEKTISSGLIFPDLHPLRLVGSGSSIFILLNVYRPTFQFKSVFIDEFLDIIPTIIETSGDDRLPVCGDANVPPWPSRILAYRRRLTRIYGNLCASPISCSTNEGNNVPSIL